MPVIFVVNHFFSFNAFAMHNKLFIMLWNSNAIFMVSFKQFHDVQHIQFIQFHFIGAAFQRFEIHTLLDSSDFPSAKNRYRVFDSARRFGSENTPKNRTYSRNRGGSNKRYDRYWIYSIYKYSSWNNDKLWADQLIRRFKMELNERTRKPNHQACWLRKKQKKYESHKCSVKMTHTTHKCHNLWKLVKKKIIKTTSAQFVFNRIQLTDFVHSYIRFVCVVLFIERRMRSYVCLFKWATGSRFRLTMFHFWCHFKRMLQCAPLWRPDRSCH